MWLAFGVMPCRWMEREERGEKYRREVPTLFFVTPKECSRVCHARAEGRYKQGHQRSSDKDAQTVQRHESITSGARASHTNLDMRAKGQLLPVFRDIVKLQPMLLRACDRDDFTLAGSERQDMQAYEPVVKNSTPP